MEEYHAVNVLINSQVKLKDKVIMHGGPTVLKVSHDLDKIEQLNNSLTFIDQTTSTSALYIYSITMSIEMVSKPRQRRGNSVGRQKLQAADLRQSVEGSLEDREVREEIKALKSQPRARKEQLDLFSTANKDLTSNDLHL